MLRRIAALIFQGLFLIPAFVSGLQAQTYSDTLPPPAAMDVITWSVGRSFRKEIRNARIPPGCRIYALPFRCERLGADTFRTPLGMKISAEVSFRFRRLAQERKLRKYNLSILSPENEHRQLFELMARQVTPPATMKEESEFWKNASQNAKPDYYLVGQYEILGDYKGVRVSQVELVKDMLNPALRNFTDKITLSDIEIAFRDEEERKAFQRLDGSVGAIEDSYARLVSQTTKGQFASIRIFPENADTEIPIGQPLKVNHGYQVECNLRQDAYLYVFYYESQDQTGNRMYAIFPGSSGENAFREKGVFRLPSEKTVFSPHEPVANQVFIKVIASLRPLPLQITESPEGFRYITPADCARFVDAMRKIPPAEIDGNNLIRGVEGL